MIAVEHKVRFWRHGLFAKYVLALVGLVVFVLAVNGALETWISYRATRTTLTDAMSEKAEASSKRIEQSISDLERQVSWVTRAYAVTLEQHRADYAQLLNGVPAVRQLAWISSQGREMLRLSRTSVTVSGGADFSRDVRFTETQTKGVNYAPVEFRLQRRHYAGRHRPRFPLGIPRRCRGRQGHVCLRDRQPRPGARELGQG